MTNFDHMGISFLAAWQLSILFAKKIASVTDTAWLQICSKWAVVKFVYTGNICLWQIKS